MKKILFIEDEAILQKTLGDALSKKGYKIVNALDGEIGLRLAKSEKPNLILLDLILPKIHGLDVLENLKADEKTKDIPVIILTNNESAEGVDRAIELGANTYLVKTHYSLDEVVEKIKKSIGE